MRAPFRFARRPPKSPSSDSGCATPSPIDPSIPNASHAEEDLRVCEELLRHGSKSFFVASRLLPARLRPDVSVVYGFCRVSDDAVDLSADPAQALRELRMRVEGVYAGDPIDHPVDRLLTAVVRRHRLPKAAILGLLEGFQWDVEGRRYATIDALEAYCVRVASTVGVLMTVLMGPRSPWVLARACDLGLAMQLTNIARDVGEDLRNRRIYLPLDWLQEAGLVPDELLTRPRHSPALGEVVRRLLNVARVYYRRAEPGIAHLPWDCRYAIGAALSIYQDIERGIRRSGYDSVNQRAYTSGRRKAVILARAAGKTAARFSVLKSPPTSSWEVAPAATFLVGPTVSRGADATLELS